MANIKSIGGNPIVPEAVEPNSVTDNMLVQTGGVLSEVHDIRTGVDGTLYAKAGDAIRGQASKLRTSVNMLQDAVFEVDRIGPYAASSGWMLTGEGPCVGDSAHKINKYKVSAGKLLYLYLSADGPCVYQWQNNSIVPAGTNPYLVGTPVTSAVDGFVTVPDGATDLIVSQLIENETNTVGLFSEKRPYLADVNQEDFWDIGSYGSGGEAYDYDTHYIRTKAPMRFLNGSDYIEFDSITTYVRAVIYSADDVFKDRLVIESGLTVDEILSMTTGGAYLNLIVGAYNSDGTVDTTVQTDVSRYATVRILSRADSALMVQNAPADAKATGSAIENGILINDAILTTQLIAHKCGSVGIEGTIGAATYSWEHGYRILEGDVQFTSDLVPVISHDGTLVGTSVTISSTNYETLKTYDMGGGSTVMSLEELLLFCKKRNLVAEIDLSNCMVDKERARIIYDLIKKYRMNGSSVLTGITSELNYFISFGSDLILCVSNLYDTITTNFIDTVKHYKCYSMLTIISMNMANATAELIEYAHSLGLVVKTWTHTTAATVNASMADGADLFICDNLYPDTFVITD